MTTPTTAELRALVAKATPGPWAWHEDYNGRWSISAPHGGRTIVMDFSRQGMQGAQPRFAISGDHQPRGTRGGILCNVDDLPCGLRAHPDAALIVAAINALPALLDRLEAAEAERDALRADAERWRFMRDRMVHQQCGPNVGWTLDTLLPGDDPDAAIDAARAGK